MSKILNDTKDILKEMLEGIEVVHKDKIKVVGNSVISEDRNENKVSLISGGGSGHEPSHAGFVGKGMLDGAVCGEIFSSPTPFDVLECIKNVPNQKGVLLIIKNYSGDVMNFQMAKDLACDENIDVDFIIVDDDIAVKNSLYTQGKRGVAGAVLVHKILGYFAKQGKTLKELKKLGEEIVKNTKTIGIGLKACTILNSGIESFELENGKIEYGCGIHGEPGDHVDNQGTSKDYALKMIQSIDDDTPFIANENYIVLINGLGRTTSIELNIFAKDVVENLNLRNIRVIKTFCGNYMTSLDMEGVSLTILKIFNDKLLDAINSNVDIIGNLY